jgi:hypothetical protein
MHSGRRTAGILVSRLVCKLLPSRTRRSREWRQPAVRPRTLPGVRPARGTATASSFACTAEPFLACRLQEVRSPGLQPRTDLIKKPRMSGRTSFQTVVISSISHGAASPRTARFTSAPSIPIEKLGSWRRNPGRSTCLLASFSFSVKRLFAQAFDTAALALHGEPVRIAEGVVYDSPTGNGAFAVSSTGALVYRSDASAQIRQLAWFDRQGRQLENVGPPGRFGGFALSPDEKRVAVQGRDPGAPAQGIWTLEISTGITYPLTTDPANESGPVWSPDSQTVLFASDRTGPGAVFQRALGSREDVPVFASTEGPQWPDDWSDDGRFILINDRNVGIVALPTTGDQKPIRLLRSDDAVIDYSRFSPDGRWVAYASTESGQAEIRVASFPEFTHIKQVSAGGGHAPQWRRDGKELFYMTGDGQLMAVGVSVTGSMLQTTAPKKLFATRGRTGTPGSDRYAVSADGNRFLVLGFDQDSRPTPITVVLNWTSMLK